MDFAQYNYDIKSPENKVLYKKCKCLLLGDGDRLVHSSSKIDLTEVIRLNKQGYERQIDRLNKAGYLERFFFFISHIFTCFARAGEHIKKKRQNRLYKVIVTKLVEDLYITNRETIKIEGNSLLQVISTEENLDSKDQSKSTNIPQINVNNIFTNPLSINTNSKFIFLENEFTPLIKNLVESALEIEKRNQYASKKDANKIVDELFKNISFSL